MGRPLKLTQLSLEDYERLSEQGMKYLQPEMQINIQGPMIDNYLSNFTCAVTEEERVIGAFGVIPTAAGVGNTWLLATDQLRARPVSLYKIGRRLIQYAYSKFGMHRLEVNVSEDFEAGQNYVIELGFGYEGIRYHFGGMGKHFYLYGRVQE